MRSSTEFDIFLSHNSRDKSIVLILAELLKNKGLRPWIDDEQILPGDSFQKVLNLALEQKKPIAICLGSSGQGPWQDGEMEVAIDQSLRYGVRVIPILLPGLENFPQNLLFLKTKSSVKFKNLVNFTEGDDDSQTLRKLVKAIKASESSHNLDISSELNDDNSEYAQLKIKLKELYDKRKEFELRLQNIEKEIQFVRLQIHSTVDDERAILVQKLLKREDLAKWYGENTLKKFINLQKEVKATAKGLSKFYLEIERLIARLSRAIEFRNIHALDNLRVDLSLLDSNRYAHADQKVYKELFGILRKDLSSRLTGEVKEELLEYLNYLEDEIFRLI